MSSGDLVPRVYGGFRGADFRGDETNIMRSPDCLNVWKDYKKTDSIRTRPGMKKAIPEILTNAPVYGIFFYKVGNTEMRIVHVGPWLYKIAEGKVSELPVAVNMARSTAFVFNDKWFFMDGQNYLQYDGETIKEVEVKVPPTTTIGGKATTKELLVSAGQKHQDINLLTDSRINTFCGDDENNIFVLDTLYEANKGCAVEGVWVNGASVSESGYTVWHNSDNVWYVEITAVPPGPATVGQDNVKIQFRKNNNKSQILNCTMIELFDNRVFFSGNPEYPNRIWHSSLQDPTYCSDLDYYNEGLDSARVKAMVAGNNNLWVFKEPSQANTTIFYHTPSTDYEYGKIYPNTHSSISTGCIGKAINFNDDIVFFSDRGMEGISGDITTEQVIAHRSSLIDSKLLKETSYADMILTEWVGYLAVIIDNKIYLADSRATFTNEDHFEYEWFYWEMSEKITCARTEKGVLWLGTENGGIYTLTDTEKPLKSHWVTPKDKFGHPQYQKTTNKRGCVVEAEGDISVYAKTDKTDFELIGTYENITDYSVCRIKRKKFKDIQLKFCSDTRFSLEQVTLESFIGGYIKR